MDVWSEFYLPLIAFARVEVTSWGGELRDVLALRAGDELPGAVVQREGARTSFAVRAAMASVQLDEETPRRVALRKLKREVVRLVKGAQKAALIPDVPPDHSGELGCECFDCGKRRLQAACNAGLLFRNSVSKDRYLSNEQRVVPRDETNLQLARHSFAVFTALRLRARWGDLGGEDDPCSRTGGDFSGQGFAVPPALRAKMVREWSPGEMNMALRYLLKTRYMGAFRVRTERQVRAWATYKLVLADRLSALAHLEFELPQATLEQADGLSWFSPGSGGSRWAAAAVDEDPEAKRLRGLAQRFAEEQRADAADERRRTHDSETLAVCRQVRDQVRQEARESGGAHMTADEHRAALREADRAGEVAYMEAELDRLIALRRPAEGQLEGHLAELDADDTEMVEILRQRMAEERRQQAEEDRAAAFVHAKRVVHGGDAKTVRTTPSWLTEHQIMWDCVSGWQTPHAENELRTMATVNSDAVSALKRVFAERVRDSLVLTSEEVVRRAMHSAQEFVSTPAERQLYMFHNSELAPFKASNVLRFSRESSVLPAWPSSKAGLIAYADGKNPWYHWGWVVVTREWLLRTLDGVNVDATVFLWDAETDLMSFDRPPLPHPALALLGDEWVVMRGGDVWVDEDSYLNAEWVGEDFRSAFALWCLRMREWGGAHLLDRLSGRKHPWVGTSLQALFSPPDV